MSRAVKIFINSVLHSGKSILSEKLLKFLIKCLVKANLKYSYILLKLFSSSLSSILKLKPKKQDNKLVNVLNYNLCFSFKFLINNILLNNINKFLIEKEQIYSKLFDYTRLLSFYRW
jgi:hypothetical protein